MQFSNFFYTEKMYKKFAGVKIGQTRLIFTKSFIDKFNLETILKNIFFEMKNFKLLFSFQKIVQFLS